MYFYTAVKDNKYVGKWMENSVLNYAKWIKGTKVMTNLFKLYVYNDKD